MPTARLLLLIAGLHASTKAPAIVVDATANGSDNTRPPCHVDLIFLVDRSGSIGPNGFIKINEGLNTTFPAFQTTIGNNLQVGIVQYSGKGDFPTPTRLGDCKTVQCLQDVVTNNMSSIKGVTYTAAAIERVVTVDFPASTRWNTSSKVLVLLTDGSATDAKKLPQMYNLTQNNKVEVHVIGIGSRIGISELRMSANGGKSDERVYQASGFNMLGEVLQNATLDVFNTCLQDQASPSSDTPPSSDDPYCDVTSSVCQRPIRIQSYSAGGFGQRTVPGTQNVANSSACSSLTGVGGNLCNQTVSIAYHTPSLAVMKGFLTVPLWPGRGSAAQEIQVPLLALIAVVPPFSVPINYTVPLNCSLPAFSDLLANAASGAASPHNVRVTAARMRCVFLDNSTKFSSFGIDTINPTWSEYSCQSNHSTIFASVMSLTTFTEPHAVTVLSYIVGVISVISLILALVVLLAARRKLRSNRTVVQINLVAALLVFHVVALFSDLALYDRAACQMVAVLAHYFLLCSVAWMLTEGITLARKTFGSALRGHQSRRQKVGTFVLAWGIPALIVAATVGGGFATHTYMAETPQLFQASFPDANVRFNRCFLQPGSVAMILGVLAPICLVVFLNTLLLVRVGHFVFKMSKESENFRPYAERNNSTTNLVEANYRHAKAGFKAMLMLVPALGIPWCIGTIQVNSHAFLYVFVITNGLQGLFLFLVYCVFNEEVRRAVRDRWERSSVGNSFQIPTPHSSQEKKKSASSP